MRVVLTGGGTGGHVVPNLAVIEELKNHKDVEMLYIGSKDGIERKLVEDVLPFRAVACGKLRRYFSMRNFLDFFKVPVGILQARKILKKFKPDVIFSKGGYVSVPTVIAARRMGVRVIVHESDVRPGLANRICFKYADKICLSFKESLEFLKKGLESKAEVTGTPVRAEILRGDSDKGHKFTGLDKHRPVILVMGGSQGAQQINELVRNSLDELLKRYQIVHLCGRGNIDIGIKKRGYVQYEYLNEELFDIYDMCEMVVTRGGANSLAEIAALKKKALVIPLGTHASRGDQLDNAEIYSREFGWAILAGDIKSDEFVDSFEMAFNGKVSFGRDVKNGVEPIVKLILSK